MASSKEERDKIKKLVWEHLGQTILLTEDILAEKWDKKTSDIIGNLDCPKYLAEKYQMTEHHIQECIQIIKDNLAHNPNVQAQISKMVAMVQKNMWWARQDMKSKNKTKVIIHGVYCHNH